MWKYQGIEQTSVPEGAEGFVYRITNLFSNKKYIGKKSFWSVKSKMVGARKRKVKVESDWKKYFGSNEMLKADVKSQGKDNFLREILHFCPSKGVLSYMELREQIDHRVLESDDFYNTWISIQIRKDHLSKLESS